ncbi:MAG: hypothetical protein RIS47_2176 [Bacteroidota bacterium]|jgi:hypothetical protein
MENNNEIQTKTWPSKIGAFVLAGVCLLYLSNWGAGFFEFLPDNLPFVGNIDEALATMLLLNAIRTLTGRDLSRLFWRNKR